MPYLDKSKQSACNARYRRRHKAQYAAYAAAYRLRHKEKLAARSAETREATNRRRKELYQSDPEKYRASKRISYQKRKEKAGFVSDYHRHKAARLAKMRETFIARKYGITEDIYKSMLKSQGGKCAVRGCTTVDSRRLSIDHDHVTGRVRGLICHKHNVGLGLLGDSQELVSKAYVYLAADQVK